MTQRISVVGLGKLGACMASKGFEVIGVDVNQGSIDLVNQGQAPVFEPGLSELVAANHARLTATSDYREAVLSSEMTFIVVPTPSDGAGGFSLRYAAEAARSIGAALAEKRGYHLVALTSTVLPGSTEFGLLPLLEEASGKRCGQDFSLCYNPEFIAMGSVIRDFFNPDFVLIGESDERAGALLEAFYQAVCDNKPTVARMSWVNAELAKLAVNTFVTTKITFANMLAELCEQLPGADVDVVTGALGLDSRIGRRYLKGGLGYGGPCFPRDNVALGYLARQMGRRALLAETTDEANRAQAERLVEVVRSHTRPGAPVAVLGLSYKPDSNVVEESQGLYLARRLAELGYRVGVFDPLAMESVRQELNNRVVYAPSLPECVAEAATVVIANPDPAFRALRREDLRRGRGPVTVVDAWRFLKDRLSGVEGITYVGLGLGNHDAKLVSQLTELWQTPEGWADEGPAGPLA